MGMVINTAARFGVSPFERAIQQLNTEFHARFRDSDFSVQIDDSSGNNRHLLKQIATAVRSSIPIRSTHPGGAYFPSVTFDNWATLGTFYKAAADNVLNGAPEFTMLISLRQIVRSTSVPEHRFLGITTENIGSSTAELVAEFSDNNPNEDTARAKVNTGGLIPLDTDSTGTIADGVNRLLTVRSNGAYTLRSSKPGNTYLLEETTLQQNLAALNRPILVNSRTDTNTGSALTPGFVIDQIAIWETDIGSTAETDLHTLWTAELGDYHPSMMQYDGSTGFYSLAGFATTGNKVTAVGRFSIAPFTGGGQYGLTQYLGGPAFRQRLQIVAFSDDHANVGLRGCIRMAVVNSSGTIICLIGSTTSDNWLDGEKHMLFAAFDGDNGTAILRIDETDADNLSHDSRVAPTTGTLETSASGGNLGVGAFPSGASKTTGNIGTFGLHDTYLTNWQDFMDGDLPKPIDEKNWTEWGAQPKFWHAAGRMDNSFGSAGDMTKNGTITIAPGPV